MCVFCCLMVVTVCWQNHPSHPYIFPWILFRITLIWPLFMIFIFSPLCLPQTGLCLRAWMWSEMTNTIKKNTSRAQHSWVKPRHALPQPSFENVISQFMMKVYGFGWRERIQGQSDEILYEIMNKPTCFKSTSPYQLIRGFRAFTDLTNVVYNYKRIKCAWKVVMNQCDIDLSGGIVGIVCCNWASI